MAQVFRCDRCGKIFDMNDSTSQERSNGRDKIMGVATFVEWLDNKVKNNFYDLCDDCLTEFFEFMETKKND